jgi:Xaa-Pro aminopeptidase
MAGAMSASKGSGRRELVADRLAIVRSILAEVGAAGALLATRRNFAWATGGGENHVVSSTEAGAVPLLVTAREAVALAPINEADRIRDEELGASRDAASGIRLETIGWFEDAKTLATEIAGGGDVLSDGQLEDRLWPHRALLTPFEHDRLAWLGHLLRDAMDETLAALRIGESELESAARLIGSVASEGVRLPVVLAAADERISRYRHPLPTAQPIRGRVMLVAVVERWGLHVAATRTRELESPDADLERRTAAVQLVERAMHQATTAGATLGAVFATAAEAYAEAGFPDEWRHHHQGGIIGYQARERIATPGDGTQMSSGMAFAWNPSIAGAKAEQTLILLAGDEHRIVT